MVFPVLEYLVFPILILVGFRLDSSKIQEPMSAVQAPHTDPDSLAYQVIEAINRNEFGSADRIIDSRLEIGSDSLQWLFLRGMRFYADVSGADNHFKKETLTELTRDLSKVGEMADARLETDPTDSASLFYGGGAYGYLSISYATDGSYFKALSTAKKGFRYHEKLISLHPDCYDAYLGPGLINLMVSASPWVLKPILFLLGLSGTEGKAHEYLTLAYEKGTRTRLEAGRYLAQLYERQQKYDKSSEIYLALTQTHPMKIDLRAEAFSALFAQKRYGEIIRLANDAMSSFESSRFSFTSRDSGRMASIFSSCSLAHKLSGDTLAATRVWNDYLSRDAYQGLNTWRAYYSLTDLYLLQKDTTLAIQSLERLIASAAPDKAKRWARNRIDELRSTRR